jgi:hypothetical protein
MAALLRRRASSQLLHFTDRGGFCGRFLLLALGDFVGRGFDLLSRIVAWMTDS